MEERETEAVRLLCHVLMGVGKYQRARDLLIGLAEAAPGDGWVERNLVLCRLRIGEYEEALPLATQLAEKAKGWDRIPALFFHAHALWCCGRLEECRRTVDDYARELVKQGVVLRKD